MELASILYSHPDALGHLHGAQRSAANAISGCRTAQYGYLLTHCGQCDESQAHPRSCGHRSCPRCLNHATSEWLDRQITKLLPCDYFMVTFTLPYELRRVAKRHSKIVYDALMACAASTLKTFAKNDIKCAQHIGFSAVLHSHTRKLDYHPHVHVVIPNGGLSKNKALWQSKPGNYLFNGKALACVFRARLLRMLREAEFDLPAPPKSWVVHCKQIGKGLPALKYLSRYLYRGVISENNILSDRDGQITFRYEDNKGKTRRRTLGSSEFIGLVLQHVLPKGFRRVRDYGFVHGNAKQTLKRVQWALQVAIPVKPKRQRPTWCCKHCAGPLVIIGFCRRRFESG
jgi:hypothetical protein